MNAAQFASLKVEGKLKMEEAPAGAPDKRSWDVNSPVSFGGVRRASEARRTPRLGGRPPLKEGDHR